MSYDSDKQSILAPALDDKFYQLKEDEVSFYKSSTGINDDEELKQHILAVQKEAYEVFPYPCIRWFMFARLQISQQRIYERFLKLGKERSGALFLEMACCFGSDVRKAVFDGYPAENCIATDLRPEFWELGYKLFRDSPEKFSVPFLPGDAFDAAFLVPAPVKATPLVDPPPKLSDLKSLTPLNGYVSAIHATNFFHLFDEAKQRHLARALAGLLDPRPGSVIFGWHVGMRECGSVMWPAPPGSDSDGYPMFCHGPESWREMWERDVFGDIPVKVEVGMDEYPSSQDVKLDGSVRLQWSVTRL